MPNEIHNFEKKKNILKNYKIDRAAYYDVFVSYSRRNLEFASGLVQKLTELKYQVWFDQNDIPPAIDFQNQIDLGITQSKNFIFIISPDSVSSPYCLKEIELADRQGKRIIPILHIESDNVEDFHPKIQKHNWIYATATQAFPEATDQLIEVLNTDKKLVDLHTQILNQALCFQKEKNSEFLIKSDVKLNEAKQFYSTLETRDVVPCYLTNLHKEYIVESEFVSALQKKEESPAEVFDFYLSFAATGKDAEETLFVKRLYAELINLGISLKTNEYDRIGGVNTLLRVENSITRAKNLLYIITPSTINNDFCGQEIELAQKHQVTPIPLLYKEPNEDLINRIPAAIKNVNWLYVREGEDYFYKTVEIIQGMSKSEFNSQYRSLYYKAYSWEREEFVEELLIDYSLIKNFLDLSDKNNFTLIEPTANMLNYFEACRATTLDAGDSTKTMSLFNRIKQLIVRKKKS